MLKLVLLTLLVTWASSPGHAQLINQIPARLMDFYLPLDDTDICGTHARDYKQNALEGVRWAQIMFDSSAQVPNPSMKSSNGYDLGNFDNCLIEAEDESLDFVPQYCLLDVTMSLTESNFYYNFGNGKRQRWAFCIPSTCSGKQLAARVQSQLNALLGVGENSTAIVKNGNCRILKDPRTKLDAGDIVAIVVLSCLAGLVIVAGIVDYFDIKAGRKRSEASTGKLVLLAFSGYTNGLSILSLKRVRGSIDCVNGIRWFCILWVMMGHRWGKQMDMPAINSEKVLANLMYYWPEMIIMNAYLAVETFFVLGGMLLSYIFLRGMEATKKFDIVTFYIYRYIRLTPPLAVLIWIYAAIMIHVGWGPLWYEQVGEKEFNCQQRWWVNLLYVNNYVWANSNEACVPQTWYLAVDMQFFVLSPALLYPLWRWPKYTFGGIFVLIILGIFSPWYITMLHNYPWQSDWRLSAADKTDYFVHMYNTAWTRFVPYVMGIVLGYVLFKCRSKKVKMSVPVVVIGWIVFFGLFLSIIFTLSLNYTKEYNQWEAGAYNSLHRVGWSLAISWLIFACHHGYGGPINTFLSWVYFQPLARLSYCAYLIHIIVQLADLGTQRTNVYYSVFETVYILIADLFYILIAAFILNLCSETPVLILEKTFLKKAPRPKKEMSPAGEVVETPGKVLNTEK